MWICIETTEILPLDFPYSVSKVTGMANEDDDLVTATDAAEMLGVSKPTLNRMALEGALPAAHKLPGLRGARLFRRSDVEALAKASAS